MKVTEDNKSEAVKEKTTPSPESIRNSSKRKKRIKEYVNGLLPSQVSTKINIRVDNYVKKAFILPSNEDDLYHSDQTEYDRRKCRQLVNDTDEDYIMAITGQPAPLDKTCLENQYTADLAQQYGLALHETLHILKTATAESNKLIENQIDEENKPILQRLHNTIEDGAIENELRTGNEFSSRAGARIRFVRDLQAQTPETLYSNNKENTVSLSFSEALDIVFYEEFIFDSGVTDVLLDPTDTRIAFDDKKAKKTINSIHPAIQSARDDIFSYRGDDTRYRISREASIKRTQRLIDLWIDDVKPQLTRNQDPQTDQQAQGTAQSSGQSQQIPQQKDKQRRQTSSEQNNKNDNKAGQKANTGDNNDKNNSEQNKNEKGDVDVDPDEIDTNSLQSSSDRAEIKHDRGDASNSQEDANKENSANTNDGVDNPQQKTTTDEDASREEDCTNKNTQRKQSQRSNPTQNKIQPSQESDVAPSMDDGSTSTSDEEDASKNASINDTDQEENSYNTNDGQTDLSDFSQNNGGKTDSHSEKRENEESKSNTRPKTDDGNSTSTQSNTGKSDSENDDSKSKLDSSNENGTDELDSTESSSPTTSDLTNKERSTARTPSTPNIDNTQSRESDKDVSREYTNNADQGVDNKKHSQEEITTPANAKSEVDPEDYTTDSKIAESEINEQSIDTESLKQDIDTLSNGNGAEESELDNIKILPEPNTNTTESWDTIKSESKRVSQRLAKQLEQSRQSNTRNELTAGTQVDPNTAYRLNQGDTRTFKRQQEGDEKEYTMVIVLDRSGSMSRSARGSCKKIETAVQAVTRFAAACESLNINIAVIDFYDDQCRYVKTPSVQTEKCLSRLLSTKAKGGTPLADAIEIAGKIANETQEKSLIIPITDDLAPDVKKVSKKVNSIHTPVCTLTIATDHTKEDPPEKAEQLAEEYTQSKYVFNGAKLADRLDQFASLIGYF